MPASTQEPNFAVLVPEPTNDLVRVGRATDGGYVVPACLLAKVDLMVSLGIENEWSFEAAFLSGQKGARVVGVDGSTGYAILGVRALRSVARLLLSLITLDTEQISGSYGRLARNLRAFARFVWFWSRPRRTFIPRMVRSSARTRLDTDWNSLRTRWTNGTPLFVKVDIEGSEYEVLPSLLSSDDSIVCLIVEFHDLDEKWDEFDVLMIQLRRRFRLVHVHANNWGGTFGSSRFPKVIEVTFAQRGLVPESGSAIDGPLSYPVEGLDFPNNPDAPDIQLRFESCDRT